MLSMDDLLIVKDYQPGYVHHWIYMENNRVVMIVARYDQNGNKTWLILIL
jgi:hypothetical protein